MRPLEAPMRTIPTHTPTEPVELTDAELDAVAGAVGEALFPVTNTKADISISVPRDAINPGTGMIAEVFTTDAIPVSDIRLKRDITPLMQLNNGLRLYRYRYLWSDEAYVGVMAQEVAKVSPEAVSI